jgi:hypothetical protein
MDLAQLEKSKYAPQMREIALTLDGKRKDKDNPMDISLEEYIKGKGDTMEAFYLDMGIDPRVDTVANMLSLPDVSARFLVPEVYRSAIRLGWRKSPIYNDLVAVEQNVSGLQFTQPAIQMSDAEMLYTGVAETIRTGDVDYTQKTVTLRKVAKGIKIPYEVMNYCSLNFISIFLEDLGIKMGHQTDMLALSTLLNGEQADGSESAATIGIANTTGGLVYRDLTKPYLRMGRLGKNPSKMVAGEDMALTLTNLPEYKYRMASGPQYATLDVKSPMPNTASLYVHSAIPSDQVLILDSSSALAKYNGQALLLESEKIVANQTEATYASAILGFGILYRDSRIVVDQSIAFSGNGFPSWMDPSTQEQTTFKK